MSQKPIYEELEQRFKKLEKESVGHNWMKKEFRRIECLLGKGTTPKTDSKKSYTQSYGNLVELNTSHLLADTIPEEVLTEIVSDYLDLLDTSAAVYERNGDYALGLFSSGWCRLLDQTSRDLCGTRDNRKALVSGKWHCHESGWNQASKVSIETGQPVDIECLGGIRLYAVPIEAGGDIIGSINFGYGDPPRDPKKLQEIAERYGLNVKKLSEQADLYETRPQFIIDLAKRRLMTSTKLIGAIVERKWAEDAMKKLNLELERKVEHRTTQLTIELNERQRAEEALRESEERYRTLVESSTDAILMLNKERNIVSCNRAFLDLFGYEKNEIEGTSIRIIHQSDESFQSFGEAAYSMIGRAGSYRTDWEFVGKNGTVFPVETVTSVIKSPDGSISGYVAIIRDITERKRAEKVLRESEDRYRSLVELSPETVIVHTEGKIVYINPEGAKILGAKKPKELIGKAVLDFIHPDYHEIVKSRIMQIQRERKAQSSIEVKYIRLDGKAIDVEATGTHITYLGKPSILSIILDVTDRKRAEEDKKRLEAQLQRAQKMEAIGTLAGGVAHDLNNVLSGIVSYPELLLMQIREDSPLRKPILTIRDSGNKAAAIVQDLLTLARRGIAITEVLNLNDIIAEYLKSPEHEKLQSYHPGIEVETNFETDLLNISGAPVHLAKTVMNLVSNAAEAMPHGGKIFISTQNRYIDTLISGYDNVKEGDYVILTVSDSGIGISSEDIERIFEPFYTKKVMGKSGTGLGMAVVWGTVKDHKGYINVQSTEGRGTTFTLYFPATRKTAKKKTPLSIEEYMGKGESILVVDDVREQREVASDILTTLGYAAHAVSSGEEAVTYLKEHTVDLIVLDMIMDPGIDGLDTYKKILEVHPGQKAIIASGYSETERVKEAQKLGAGQYIKKPYAMEKIGLAVKEELGK